MCIALSTWSQHTQKSIKVEKIFIHIMGAIVPIPSDDSVSYCVPEECARKVLEILFITPRCSSTKLQVATSIISFMCYYQRPDACLLLNLVSSIVQYLGPFSSGPVVRNKCNMPSRAAKTESSSDGMRHGHHCSIGFTNFVQLVVHDRALRSSMRWIKHPRSFKRGVHEYSSYYHCHATTTGLLLD